MSRIVRAHSENWSIRPIQAFPKVGPSLIRSVASARGPSSRNFQVGVHIQEEEKGEQGREAQKGVGKEKKGDKGRRGGRE